MILSPIVLWRNYEIHWKPKYLWKYDWNLDFQCRHVMMPLLLLLLMVQMCRANLRRPMKHQPISKATVDDYQSNPYNHYQALYYQSSVRRRSRRSHRQSLHLCIKFIITKDTKKKIVEKKEIENTISTT